MMFIDELYQKSIADSEKNLQFWENYLNELKCLNFNVYAEQLKVPILVPIGSKIVFRGELKHTNELTVSLGADYFVKCSTTQAEVLRQHRLKDAQMKVDLYRQEKEYLENKISFTKQNVYESGGQEILEVYSEEEDKAWRKKHRENVKKFKQEAKGKETKPKDDTNDADLWERLEELELQEELENELLENYNEIVDKRKENTFLATEETLLRNSFKEESNEQKSKEIIQNKLQENFVKDEVKSNPKEAEFVQNNVQEISKLDLLQKVLDKQNKLESKLHELKHRERKQTKTEQDLLSRLDEMEQLDEVEDEIDRLDDILETEEEPTESVENINKSEATKLQKCITFADDNESETIEITFKHSDMKPNKEPFNPEKGISKPSDVYEAYSHFFDSKTTSILKKSKYEIESIKEIKKTEKKTKQVMFGENVITESLEPEDNRTEGNSTIIVKDVVENVGVNQHKIEGGARPTSIFKKKRMQNKS